MPKPTLMDRCFSSSWHMFIKSESRSAPTLTEVEAHDVSAFGGKPFLVKIEDRVV